jgi:hypothetical protein
VILTVDTSSRRSRRGGDQRGLAVAHATSPCPVCSGGPACNVSRSERVHLIGRCDGPTIRPYEAFNPARAQVSTEYVFALAMIDVMTNEMTPQAVAEKAFKRADEIFAQYPIEQA